MRTLDEMMLQQLKDVSRAFCNDVPRQHDPRRQEVALFGTMKGYFDEISPFEAQARRVAPRNLRVVRDNVVSYSLKN